VVDCHRSLSESAAVVEASTQRTLVMVMFALAFFTFVALRFISAPYGRYTRGGWGPTLPERLGWMIMESPSLILFSTLFWTGPNHDQRVPQILWALWASHYLHRTLLYPLRLKSNKRMPLAIVAMAIAFNVLNATINGSWIGTFGDYTTVTPWDPRFLAGLTLFVCGMAINVDADRRLFALRAPGETGYKIPRGGLYELVTSPNYLGEILEWSGWALASASWGGLAFAVYTFANLAPRALTHHAWYQKTFADYPERRKALIPFVW
jgi:protein-S-isoprenylcysteine O-methyltransferase Ste14